MMAGPEERGPAFGMMHDADRMPVIRMRVPVQTPTVLDVAVVLSPVDADARGDPQQEPGIEDARVKPVTGAARVQPLPPEQTCEQERCGHSARVALPPDAIGRPAPADDVTVLPADAING
jgi:hypothetical protein